MTLFMACAISGLLFWRPRILWAAYIWLTISNVLALSGLWAYIVSYWTDPNSPWEFSEGLNLLQFLLLAGLALAKLAGLLTPFERKPSERKLRVWIVVSILLLIPVQLAATWRMGTFGI